MSDIYEIGQAVGEIRQDIKHLQCINRGIRRDIRELRSASNWNRRLILLAVLYGISLVGNLASDKIAPHLASVLELYKLLK